MIPSPEQHKAALDAARAYELDGGPEGTVAVYLSALLEQTGEAEAARELALNCAINTQANRADRADRAESDLSSAREEIADLDRLVFRLELGGEPWGSELMAIRDGAISRHREALRSSRTKGAAPRVAVPSSDIGADAANEADLPEHLRWKGDGPAPASWFAADGTKVYRSYRDYCDD